MKSDENPEAVTEELMKSSASAAELARLCYEGQRRARESGTIGGSP